MARKKEKTLDVQTESGISQNMGTIVIIFSVIMGSIFLSIFYLDFSSDKASEYNESVTITLDGKEVVHEADNTTQRNLAKEKVRMDGDFTVKWETAGGILEISWIDYLVFAVAFYFMPYGRYKSSAVSRKRAMEAKFPDFMRDLAEFWKGGLSMTSAVDTLAKGEYGALNAEVSKMAQQLSWGISFNEVLGQFSNRVKSSMVERSVALVGEANRAGGEISDILLTVSNDARELKVLAKEKEGVMASYISIIITAFLIYVLIIAAMVIIFVPAIAGSTDGVDTSNTSFGGMSIKQLNPALVSLIFFYSVMVQGLGGGLNAGIMGKGTISDGLKYAATYLMLGWAIFEFLAFTIDVRMGL